MKLQIIDEQELDRWIAENVMGWQLVKGTYLGSDGPIVAETTGNWVWIGVEGDGEGWLYNKWQPTKDISMAWVVRDRILAMNQFRHCYFQIREGKFMGGCEATIVEHNPPHKLIACSFQETAMMAICTISKVAIEGI